MDAARLALLRRRVLWLAYAVGSVLIALSLLGELAVLRSGRPVRAAALSPAVGGLLMIVIATVKSRRERREVSLRRLVRRTMLVVVLAVVMQIPASAITAKAISRILVQAGFQHVQIGLLAPLLVSMLCVHVAAALVVPWSLRESAVPVLVIVALALLVAPTAPDPWPATLGGTLPLALWGL